MRPHIPPSAVAGIPRLVPRPEGTAAAHLYGLDGVLHLEQPGRGMKKGDTCAWKRTRWGQAEVGKRTGLPG